ncbi:MAG: fatty acid hydroxylase, partial [Bacteroidota bacterium]
MDPKTKPSTSGSRQLFRNPILELLTRTHISVTLILYTALPVILLIYGFNKGHLTVGSAITLFLSGIVAFTLVEYLMHRFLFHIEPTSEFRKRFAHIVHGTHHEFPRDKARISMPPLPSVLLATFFFLFFRL